MISAQLRPGAVLRFDECDLPCFATFKWKVRRNITPRGRVYSYATLAGSGAASVSFHRLILGVAEGLVVDHIDGDGLNNIRANLRVCTHAENMRNRRVHLHSATGVKGVSLRGQTYTAEVRSMGTRLKKGGFRSIKEAADWYDAQACALHGEFARRNALPEPHLG